jgi:hypothetical protein
MPWARKNSAHAIQQTAPTATLALEFVLTMVCDMTRFERAAHPMGSTDFAVARRHEEPPGTAESR